MAVRRKGLKAVSNLEAAFLALLLQTKPAESFNRQMIYLIFQSTYCEKFLEKRQILRMAGGKRYEKQRKAARDQLPCVVFYAIIN